MTKDESKEGQERLGDLYDHLLWFKNFAKDLPKGMVISDANELANEVLYVMGWFAGRIYEKLP